MGSRDYLGDWSKFIHREPVRRRGDPLLLLFVAWLFAMVLPWVIGVVTIALFIIRRVA